MKLHEAKQNITGSTLKFIAAAAMLTDHVAAVFLKSSSSAAIILHIIGRLAFPIIVFMLVEGFCHTRNVKKYLLRLVIFAIVSEVPYNLCFSGKMFSPAGVLGLPCFNNVLFTLAAALVALWAIRDIFENQNPYGFLKKMSQSWRFILTIIAVLLDAFITYLIGSDYAVIGVIGACAMYLLRYDMVKAVAAEAVIQSLYSLSDAPAFLAIPLIRRYNGQRGLKLKYFFYIFYPAHLMVLWLIQKI